jgi:hypothetical protein
VAFPIDAVMNNHLRALRELIADDLYFVDDQAVAAAIIARSTVHMTVARASFRSDAKPPNVRSFRRDEHARSFRLERSPRLHRSR